MQPCSSFVMESWHVMLIEQHALSWSRPDLEHTLNMDWDTALVSRPSTIRPFPCFTQPRMPCYEAGWSIIWNQQSILKGREEYASMTMWWFFLMATRFFPLNCPENWTGW